VSNSNIHEKELTELVHDIVREIDIVIKNVLIDNGELVCVVETDSSKKAKDIIFAIHQHNKKSDIKIIVTKHEKPKHIVPGKQCLSSDEENVLLEKMDTEARTALSKHNEIITEIISRIQIITDETVVSLFTSSSSSGLSGVS
jgi:NCAIR mutase (PurE)-related protein